MSYSTYEVDKAARTAIITFNRPEKLNAITRPDIREVLDQLSEAERDDNVAVVIIKGAGRAFGTGFNIDEVRNDRGFNSGGRRPSLRELLRWDRETLWGGQGLFRRFFASDKVTIAQVHGYCYGIHLELMTACDLAIASADARFDHPGWRYLGIEGHLPVYILMLGWRRVKEMLLVPGGLSAARAQEWGLVNRVVPPEALDRETRAVAERIAQNPIDGTVAGKASFLLAMDLMGAKAGYTAATIAHTFMSNLRFEPGELNLMKELATKGRHTLYKKRDERYGSQHRPR